MIRRLFSSQLRINMTSGVAATIINTIVLAVAYPLYLHFLGYERYGAWLVLSTVLSFAYVGNLGVSQAVMKLVAEEYGREDIAAVEQYIASAFGLLALSGVLVLFFAVVFRSQIVGLFRVSGENRDILLWLIPFVGALSVYVFLVQVLGATLSGFGRMDLTNYVQTGARATGVGVSGLLLWKGWGVESLLIGNVLTYVATHVAAVVLIRRIAPVRFLRLRNFSCCRCRRLLSFGGAVFGGSLVTMLVSPFNRLMLSRYAGLASIPVYDISFNAAMQIRGLIEAGLRAMVPEVSRVGANMSRQAVERIRQINRRAIGVILALGLPVYLALLALAPCLLRLWLRDRFVDAVPPAFRIFLIGTFVSLLCVPAYHTLLGLGRAIQCLVGQAILGLTGVVLVVSIVLWREGLSATDVAFASLPGFVLTSSYIVIQQRRELRAAWSGGEVVSTLDQMQPEAT